MVEDPFDQAHAGGCIHQALSRAQALLVANPARGKGSGECTLRASALPTVLAEIEVLLLGWGGRDQRQPLLACSGAHPSCGNLCRLEVQRLRGGAAGGSRGGGEDFRFRGSEATWSSGSDCIDGALVGMHVWMVVHCWGGCSMVQQSLIRGCAAAAADRAGPPTEGNPWVGGGLLVGVGLAPALLVVLVLVIVMMVVVCPQEGLLILTKPGDSSVRSLLAWGLLRDNGGAVDVVILHMRRLYLVDGVDGERVLQAAVWHSTVQQGLGYKGGGYSGDVVGNPGLHV